MLPALTLVLGGAASGKSGFAENLLLSSDLEPFYVATARPGDEEIKYKINLHRQRRGQLWTDTEAHGDLTETLKNTHENQGILLDCATMWLTNRMMAEKSLDTAPHDFMQEIAHAKASMVVVSNEIGQGIVPADALSRAFREAQGRLNIAIAQRADLVVQVVAGLPNVLKGTLP